MPKRQITVDFDEIFNFAGQEPYNISWNKCCDIFHRGAILCTDEGRNTTLYLEDIEGNLKYDEENAGRKHAYSEEEKLGFKIVVDFMKKHKLKEMYVNND